MSEILAVMASFNAQRFRTTLTLLGIILGVATLVSLSCAIEGLHHYMLRGMQQASGDDVVTLKKKWDSGPTDKKAQPLDRFDARALATHQSLSGSQVLSKYTLRVPWGGRWGQWIWVAGTTPKALGFYGLEVAKGRFVVDEDVRDRSPVAVLGADAVDKLLPGERYPLGQEIRLQGKRFRVVGTLKRKPALGKGDFQSWEGTVVVPETAFIDRLAKTKEVREIVVKTAPDVLEDLGLARVVDVARAVVMGRHHGVENFHITDPAENAKTEQLTRLIVGGLELAIAFVCLVVGGINLMNIMLVSVIQRTREIGVRRALGATRSSIRRLFLIEASVLAGVGGLLGVAGGTAFAWLLAQVLNIVFGYWPFVFVPLPAVLGFASSVITGMAFGLYPAHRAAGLSPIECLRYE